MFEAMNHQHLNEHLGYLLAHAVNLSDPDTQGRFAIPLETSYDFYKETAMNLMQAALNLAKGLELKESDGLVIRDVFFQHVQATGASAADIWDQIVYQCRLPESCQAA